MIQWPPIRMLRTLPYSIYLQRILHGWVLPSISQCFIMRSLIHARRHVLRQKRHLKMP
nr:hypothetical protein Iba_chr01bCG17930 [Ipomoea batatas]